jgi:hypothetical protein
MSAGNEKKLRKIEPMGKRFFYERKISNRRIDKTAQGKNVSMDVCTCVPN